MVSVRAIAINKPPYSFLAQNRKEKNNFLNSYLLITWSTLSDAISYKQNYQYLKTLFILIRETFEEIKSM